MSQQQPPATFTLKNGDQIQVSLDEEGRIGAGHYRLKVVCLNSQMVVMPGSGNAIEISSPRALEIEENEVRRLVAEREAKKPAKNGALR